ncbi:MAG: UDP-N-acetylmuramoyl-tripeptide--D-alanyl-D-alanine ligase [Pseudomonadota bacterium]
MIGGTLNTLAKIVDGRTQGADAPWRGVSTDSRSIGHGELFIALNGPNHRGRDFVKSVAGSGAAAALVDRFTDDEIAQVEVYDTRHALGVLAADWREQFDFTVIGVTGSNGKTSVKQMIAACLGENALATRGNFNNDIGVPKMLLELDATHSSAVFEMGANHAGEIAYLASLVRPTIAVITNAGPSHLEGFGSVDGVAHAKGELFYALNSEATAIVNRDDRYFDLWCELAAPATVKSFGLSAAADCYADNISLGVSHSDFDLVIGEERYPVRLPLPGEHNVLNACAAALAVHASGIDLRLIAQRLVTSISEKGRLMARRTNDGALVIDDTYNANPASMRAAARHAVGLDKPVLMVLGDMGELGPDAEALHFSLGQDFAKIGVERLAVCGDLMAHTAEGFAGNARHFDSQAALIDALLLEDLSQYTVLVKGSRSQAMENVVAALVPAEGRA